MNTFLNIKIEFPKSDTTLAGYRADAIKWATRLPLTLRIHQRGINEQHNAKHRIHYFPDAAKRFAKVNRDRVYPGSW